MTKAPSVLLILWAGLAVAPRAFAENELPDTTGRYGYIDRNGRTVIPHRFDFAREFTEGLASVRTGDSWGFIDRAGNFALEPSFEYVWVFSEGLAPVKIDGRWGFMDHDGTAHIKPRFDDVGGFSEGLAAVRSIPEPPPPVEMAKKREPMLVTERPAVTAAKRRASEAAYLKGVACYQNGDYTCARMNWGRAKLLNPEHPGVDEWLRRLDDWGYWVRGGAGRIRR